MVLAACGGEDGNETTGSGAGASGPGGAGAGAGTGTGTATGTATGSGGSGTGTATGSGGGNSDIPGGGTVLFEENFDDANFGDRGWYDGASGAISNEAAPGSSSSFECQFQSGAQSCADGKPARHLFDETPTIYMGLWLKLSSNWVGSGVPYHPHMFHFITNEDSQYVGPANSHLTTYTEVVDGGRALLAIQDSMNVDDACILLNNDSFVGCNGDFDSYTFTENRSVAACNGLVGEVDGRDCFDNGYWYSSRSWSADGAITDDAWHYVEVYFELSTIENGEGVPNGKIRWVQDGQTLISSDQILLRTGAHPTMAFNQFAMLPYIGPGSPVVQSFWVDDLVVATAKP